MNPGYEDIRTRIAEEPTWFDGNGVPRYGDFGPRMLGVYDVIAMHWLIACQACEREFQVADGWTYTQYFMLTPEPWLSEFKWRKKAIEEGPPHYGDPPIHGCVGDTMNVDFVRTLGIWTVGSDYEWHKKRIKTFGGI